MNKLGVLLGLVLAFTIVSSAKASEGTASLYNTVGEPSKCWAASILERNYNYKLIVTCRDLRYPAIDASVFDYVIWAVPVNGKSPEKLGSLGFGKAEFDTRIAFSELFVTKEGQQQGFGSNMGPVVMRGAVQPIGFLEQVNPPTATPMPTLSPGKNGQATTTVASKLTSSLQWGGIILRIVGIAFLLGVVAIVVVILASSMGGKKNVPPGL